MKALVWKEWQESKMALAIGILLLIAFPLVMVVYHRVLYDDEWALGCLTLIGAGCTPIIAAVWGSFVFCKEVIPGYHRFLGALPLEPKHLARAKGFVSGPLLVLLFLLPLIADGVVLYFTGQLGPEEWTIAGDYMRYVFALLGTVGISYLAASVFRKLVPAVISGLGATFVAAMLTTLWNWYRMPEGNIAVEQNIPWLLAIIGVLLYILAFSLSPYIETQVPRHRASSQKGVWAGVIALLALTAWITSIFASNTTITHRVPFEGNWVHGNFACASTGNTLYCLERPLVQLQNDAPNWADWRIHKYTFDDLAQVINTEQSASKIDGATCEHVWPVQPSLDEQFIDVCCTTNQEKVHGSRHQLMRLNLDTQSVETDHISPLNSRMFVTDEHHLYAIEKGCSSSERQEPTTGQCLRIYDLRSPNATPMSELCFAEQNSPALIKIHDHILPHTHISEQVDKLITVDVADPTAPRIESVVAIPNPTTRLQRQFHRSSEATVASSDNRLAVSSSGGLWLYELQPDGQWNLLGHRKAPLIETMARNPFHLVWKDDRIYESNVVFGILIYDVSDPSRPRRAAHIGEWAGCMFPLPNNTVAVFAGDKAGHLSLEFHRLPQ